MCRKIKNDASSTGEVPKKATTPYNETDIDGSITHPNPYVNIKTRWGCAERQNKGLSTRRTLHADVTTAKSGSNAQPDTNVPQKSTGVNLQYMQDEGV